MSGLFLPVSLGVMSRPKRLESVSYIGLAQYFLTFCVRGRRRVFTDGDLVAQTLEHFRQTATLEQFAILAYCVMPDHVHLLVEAVVERADLRRFAAGAKQRSGLVEFPRQYPYLGSDTWSLDELLDSVI